MFETLEIFLKSSSKCISEQLTRPFAVLVYLINPSIRPTRWIVESILLLYLILRLTLIYENTNQTEIKFYIPSLLYYLTLTFKKTNQMKRRIYISTTPRERLWMLLITLCLTTLLPKARANSSSPSQKHASKYTFQLSEKEKSVTELWSSNPILLNV